MYGRNLQEAIDAAGSPINLLWVPDAKAWTVPVVPPEYRGWAQEQVAWRETVALFDLSYHMFNSFIVGPDAVKLLSEVSANNYEKFAIGQAKQFIPVAYDGNIITDGILLRNDTNSFTLAGPPASHTWVGYHARTGGYDVEVTTEPDASVRKEGDPSLFRFQIQGPAAMEVMERALGGPAPEVKFFHSAFVDIDGKRVRALRHGMAGQAGFELIGDYADYDAVKDALVAAGTPNDLQLVGGMAYFTNGVESGWIPTPTPAIYTDPKLRDYRESISEFSFEGKRPLSGSYFSENIEDYYLSPWELGYGRSIHLDHEFIGRDALAAARETATRKRVTIEFNREDVARVLGADLGYFNTYARLRIEDSHGLQGMTYWTTRISPLDRVLALSIVDASAATPGTEVEVVYGSHPGAGTASDADLGFERIRGIVQPSPYDQYARTQYRANTPAQV
ncbi:aminomethyltransferase family protein [Gulosibacter chungangensis]|uniref:Aminomethyl transferase family protein n=1 Tax=Gulosibacter chungangensis TaxID=979746 RepID=A0A7J5B7X8_9MICO|nr:aminomethyltransferase family protein [Gulosibacter chungangensis]KAB1641230.1 aminomethyl transferase family protein [Gulosibacter chungangensis]